MIGLIKKQWTPHPRTEEASNTPNIKKGFVVGKKEIACKSPNNQENRTSGKICIRSPNSCKYVEFAEPNLGTKHVDEQTPENPR